MPPEYFTIAAFAARLRTGATSAEAMTEACLARIADRNPMLNAFIAVFGDVARAEARRADRELANGLDRGPLHGVPISLKDLIDVRGTPTTAASRVRDGHIASADAAVVSRLREAGAVLIGKCNLHEFAFGTTNEESAYGPVRHPADPMRSPGGSSGGSAVSVSTGMALASIGTDTGGSIRIPAAACGLVGLKPARGDISTAGVVPLSRTLDHVGPLCHTVEDAELVHRALAPGAQAAPAFSARALRLGVLTPYFGELLEPAVESAFAAARDRLRRAGVILEEVAIPHAPDIASVYLLIVLTEAAAYHATTLDRMAEAYSPDVRIRLETGRYILGEDYARALAGRECLQREVDHVLADYDGLVLPSLTIRAPLLGTSTAHFPSGDQPIRASMLRLTQLFNVTGHAALSIPCSVGEQDLPVGVQLVGTSTESVLALGRTLEHHLRAG